MAKTRKNKDTQSNVSPESPGISRTTIGLVLAGILIIIAAAVAAPSLGSLFTPARNTVDSGVTVYFFYGEECPHCHDIMPFVESLEEKYPDVGFQYLEVWHDPVNLQQMQIMGRDLGTTETSVPRVIVGDMILVGGLDIPNGLEQAIIEQKKKLAP